MLSLQITDIIPETSTAKTFVLQPLDDTIVHYKAGQFLTLVFETKFGEKRRSYSISSSPGINEPLTITIKRVENGEFSRLLLSHAKVGDILKSSGVSGLFCLPDNIDTIDQFFFLAAGSGITPIYSIIKTLLVTTKKMVVLIYSNKSEGDTIFQQQLLLLQQQYPQQFKIRFLFSNNIDVHNSRLSNWLLKQFLESDVATAKSRTQFYMCGPFDYMQMIQITLLGEGLALANIRKENFNALPRIVKPVPPDTGQHQVMIHFENKVHQVAVQYPASILAAAKAANIQLPFSCEAGRCGSCAATCIKGKIWMAYNEVLMDDEIAKGRILCCQSYPVGGSVEIVV